MVHEPETRDAQERDRYAVASDWNIASNPVGHRFLLGSCSRENRVRKLKHPRSTYHSDLNEAPAHRSPFLQALISNSPWPIYHSGAFSAMWGSQSS